jgi:hypothetical protein
MHSKTLKKNAFIGVSWENQYVMKPMNKLLFFKCREFIELNGCYLKEYSGYNTCSYWYCDPNDVAIAIVEALTA